MEHLPYEQQVFTLEEMRQNSQQFLAEMQTRRSIRFFSDAPVPKEIIQNILQAACTAPSGANKQPWVFCAISNSAIKKEIRKAAEVEEYAFYNGRASEDYLKDVAAFGTNWQKPFLEIAPWIIVVFKKIYDDTPEGRAKNYYVQESVGLAAGILIAAIHKAGLVSLTHTPSPMNFLCSILNRPVSEKPFLLLPIGFPAADATVPNLKRKSFDEMAIFIE